MSNFIEEFKKGQTDKNKGLYMGIGLHHINKAINGVQRAMIYGISSSPKVGKSTLVDYGFVIQPYLYALENNIDVTWIYYSFEMDRVTKEFDFASYFLFHDYNIYKVMLPEGIFCEKENFIILSSNYLRGLLQDDNGNIIKVTPFIQEKLKEVYEKRIVPLFGEYSKTGEKLKSGKIDFITHRENPTGLNNYMLKFASRRGLVNTIKYKNKAGENKESVISYTPNNPDEYVIVIVDTLRKIPKERGFSMKENVDKMIEYMVDIRNMYKYTFVPIIHLNRSMTDVNRLKFMDDMIFPNGDDIKDRPRKIVFNTWIKKYYTKYGL